MLGDEDFTVVVIGGVLYWRGIIGHPATTASAGAQRSPGAKAAKLHAPLVLPSDAPKIAADADREVIDPFALKLAKVNAMAHKIIVTNAEYHDTDDGQTSMRSGRSSAASSHLRSRDRWD